MHASVGRQPAGMSVESAYRTHCVFPECTQLFGDTDLGGRAVCSCLVVRIAGSNTAKRMNVLLLCFLCVV
jgi:hypothetical protein